MSRIGDRIRNIRTMKGLTQKQLAKAVGVTENFIAEVEAGRKILNDELLKRVARILEQSIDDAELCKTGETSADRKTGKIPGTPAVTDIQKVWIDAMDSVIKNVPLYEYDLKKVVSTRKLPVVSNKVDGFAKDKVFFLKIQDDDMVGFRISKGDIAFCYMTHEIENNAIYLLEYGNRRVIRQIKKLDGDKILIVSNKGGISTEMMYAKDIKVLARLVRVEIDL